MSDNEKNKPQDNNDASNEEKPLGLRDKLMIEVLNGYISHSNVMLSSIRDIDKAPDMEEVERVVRQCYKVADIIRKVRLTSF